MPAYFTDSPTGETLDEKRTRRIANARKLERSRTIPLKKSVSGPHRKRAPRQRNPERRAKRERRNREYYASPEWRAKKKAVHERDDFQCTELVGAVLYGGGFYPSVGVKVRCENRGEVVNGKQTARGLVCEEKSYGHRGVPGRIDTCRTRCKDCDRRLTPLERANHANGFRRSAP